MVKSHRLLAGSCSLGFLIPRAPKAPCGITASSARKTPRRGDAEVIELC